MNNYINLILIEMKKLISYRSWWITCMILLILQPILGYIEAQQLLATGLDATPLTNPELIEVIPPIEYFGFDTTLMIGIVPLIITSSILGTVEYTNHNLRTTLLCNSSRFRVIITKLMAFVICIVLVSFLSIFITISFEQLGLGSQGLQPIILSFVTWQYIMYATINYVMQAMIVYTMALLFRNAFIPILITLPQVYLLGDILLDNINILNKLPMVAGNYLYALPTSSSFNHNPLFGIFVLISWFLVLSIITLYSFIRRDVGGRS